MSDEMNKLPLPLGEGRGEGAAKLSDSLTKEEFAA